jgi:hypothetical protein
MSHSNYRDLMAAALDAPLASADRATLDEHLLACAACRAVWEALVEVDALLAHAPTVPAPAGFAARTAAQVAARTSRPRVVGGGLILTLGAVVVFSLAALPLAGLINALLNQPGTVVALARALAAMINVLAAVGGGLWLALFALLDWSASQPAVGGLALATLPLALAWVYFFRRFSPKAVTL